MEYIAWPMWQLEPTTTFEKDSRLYSKKHPHELASVLRNLSRYMAQLSVAPNAKSVKAGYLHDEPPGVVAIDQRGTGAGNLQETRLYTFANEAEKVLYIITLGNKSTQARDIAFSKEFVKSLNL